MKFRVVFYWYWLQRAKNPLHVKQVVAIRDVIPPPLRREFTDVYIATELMDTDLHQIIRSNQSLSEEHCQVVHFQFDFNLIIIK